MRDVSGPDLHGIEYVRSAFERMADLYDYESVHPSPLELMSTLETKSGPAIRDEVYNFTDKGGREVGLRFDFTMGLTRHVVSDRARPLPAKISSFGGVFRYDEPQKNRYRYFHQWDIEIYGQPHPAQDAEIIEFTSRFLDSLPVSHNIRISHREIMESYIAQHFGTDSINDILRAVDKMQKKAPSDIVDEFIAKGYDKTALEDMMEFASAKGTPDDIKSYLSDRMYNYLDGLIHDLDSLNIRNVIIDFGIVRGLDYYTGMVFEAYGAKSDVALAGGGRYDMLPAAFGRKDMGAAGVAGGVERIVSAMGSIPCPQKRVAVIYVQEGMRPRGMVIAAALRHQQVPVSMDVSARSLKKQMSMAQHSDVAIIVAPKEMQKGMVIFKDMKGGSESLVSYDKIISNPLKFIKEMPW